MSVLTPDARQDPEQWHLVRGLSKGSHQTLFLLWTKRKLATSSVRVKCLRNVLTPPGPTIFHSLEVRQGNTRIPGCYCFHALARPPDKARHVWYVMNGPRNFTLTPEVGSLELVERRVSGSSGLKQLNVNWSYSISGCVRLFLHRNSMRLWLFHGSPAFPRHLYVKSSTKYAEQTQQRPIDRDETPVRRTVTELCRSSPCSRSNKSSCSWSGTLYWQWWPKRRGEQAEGIFN